MASTKEKKLTKYEQNAARHSARSIGSPNTSQTSRPSTRQSEKQRQLDQFAQNFERKYGKPIQTTTDSSTAKQAGVTEGTRAASRNAAKSQYLYNQPSMVPGMDLSKEDNDTVYDTAARRLQTLYQHQNNLAARSATMDPVEYSRQWSETQKQAGQMEALRSMAANQRYYENNQKALEAVQSSGTNAIYQAGRNAKQDQQTILQLVAPNAQNQPGYAEAVQRISTAYGISPQTSGTEYQKQLQTLYSQLEDTREKSSRSVNAAGFDYDRLEEYEERIQQDAENAMARENVRAFAKEHPVAASALSVAVQPAAGLDYLQQLLLNIGHNNMDEADSYRPMSADSMTISNFVSDIRGGVSEEIEKHTDWEIFGQNVASFLYQTGMSVADSALLVGAMGSGATLFMGMSAASQATSDALSRGASNGQALMAGLAGGAAEMLFEKVSIDQLLKPKNVTSVKRLLQETMKQAGVEASEEGLTEIANILTDAAIMGENSNFSISVERYKAQGLPESEAKKQAYLDMVSQVGWAAAGGALSGAVMGGAVNTARLGAEKQTAKAVKSETDRLNEAAQDIDEGIRPERRDPASQTPESAEAYRQELPNAVNQPGQRHPQTQTTDYKTDQPIALNINSDSSVIQAGNEAGDPASRPYSYTGTTIQQRIDDMAATFGKDGEMAFRKASEKVTAEELPKLYGDFVAAYNSASRKITPEQASKINNMPPSVRDSAYQAGIADYSASLSTDRTATALKPGLVRDQSYIKGHYTAKTARALDTLAKAAGVAVRIVDEIPAYDASGNLLGMANARYHNGTIEIARNAQDPAGVAFTHELIHRVRQTDPEAYRTMAHFVIENLSYDRYSSALGARTKNYRDLDESNMQEELVADAFGRVLGDSEYLDRIVRQNRTVWQRILDTIRDFISRIRHVSSNGLNESERQEFSELVGKAEQMASLLENALDRAKTAQNVQTENAAREDGAERYSINQSFRAEIQEWYKEGQPKGERFVLGSTGPVLQGLGAIESDIYINGDKISTILKQHPEMTIREVQRIPEILEDPVLVLKSRNVGRGRQQNSRLVLFGAIKAQDGRPVMCVLDLRPTENGFFLDDMQKVSSAYTKDVRPMEFVSNSEVLHADEKRTIPLLRTIGFKMPIALQRSGSIGSITYKGPKVNLEGVPFSSVVEAEHVRYSLKSTDSQGRELTKAQQEFFKDSRAIDRQGRLLVLYHQTDGAFTVFDPRHQGAGSRDNATPFGIFLKTSNQNIGLKGQRQMELYANITNPLIASDREALTYSLLKLSDEYASIRAEIDKLDNTYHEKFEQVKQELRDFMTEWRRNNPDASRRALYDVPEFNTLYEAEDAVVEEWTQKADQLSTQAKNVITAALQNAGYDGIILSADTGSFGRSTDAYIALDPEQVKNASNKHPTRDPDIRYSLMSKEISDMSNHLAEQLQAVNAQADAGEITQEEATAQKMAILQAPIRDLIAQYGQMEPGERPARKITIPRKTEENMRVSRTARTALEAEATPDELVPDIEQLVAEGVFSYEAYGDEQARKDAESKILAVGYETALADWTNDVRRGNVSKLNTALGWRLYDEAANKHDTKTAMTVLTNLIEHQRNAAQAVQATRILKQMPPSAQLYGVQRSIQNLQEEINRRYGAKKGPELKIDEDLAQQFMEAQSQQQRDEVLKDIYRDIGHQMPSTFMDKWNAWRYFAMLGNPRTHLRNIFGNFGFAPVVIAKDLTATAIESAVYRVTGGRTQRTKGAIGAGKADRSLLAVCWGDYANVQDAAMGTAKYNDSVNANRYIQEGRRIFKSENRTLNKLLAPVETASKGNSSLLEAEDLFFFKPHYAYALAQYCKANHISAEDVRSGKIPDAARGYAILEAQKATYRDTNQFSQIISNLGRTDRSTGAGKTVGMVVEGILPFRKTPANILVRGLEYSPLGILNALKIGVKDIKAGKATAADVIDAVSSALTGTGLLALGIFLAAEGLVRGHGDDDDENSFLELQGHQQYSIEVGGQSFTLDWLAPEALPLFVGVNIYEQGGMGAKMSDWLAAVQNISEPLLEMSCLQSLNDMFDNIGYVQSEGLSGLTAALAGAATSYLTQAIPTAFGQAERTSQPDRMTTFTNKGQFLTTDAQYTLGRASSRIPFWDFQQIPYIDAWGRTETTESVAVRAVDNFLNPAYRSQVAGSEMEDELLRLYDQTGSPAVFPSRADKSITVGGEKKYLTADQYVNYATKKGELSYRLVNDLVASSAYSELSDEEKVTVVSDVYEYANAIAKSEVSDYRLDSWIKKASDAAKKGIPVELYIISRLTVGAITEGIPSRSDPDKSIPNSTSLLKMEQLYNISGLSASQRQSLYEAFGISEDVQNMNRAAVQERIRRMRQTGR